MHRQTVLDVVSTEGLMILHDLAGEDEAQLIGLCVKLLGDCLLKLPACPNEEGGGRRRGGEKRKKQTQD